MATRPGYIPTGRMSGTNSGMMMTQGGPMIPPGGNQFTGYMNVQQLQQHQQSSQPSQPQQAPQQPQQLANYSRIQPGGVNMGNIQNFQGGYGMNHQDQMQMGPTMGHGLQNNGMSMNMPSNNGMQMRMGPNITGNIAGVNNSSPHTMAQSTMTQENVRNVWRWNLEEQMAVLRDLIERYKYISIDCKFPGIVARPIGTFKTTSEYHYQTLRSNVDLLQPVQLGMSFADEFGNRPVGIGTWQFNFKFNAREDMCSADGMDLLSQGGVVFDMHEVEGIDPFAFGELLISSGMVLDDSINWITFHSGYDLGYLLSVMLNDKLPVEETGFLQTLSLYFPTVWDVKHVVRMFHSSPKTTIGEVADDLNVRGPNVSRNNSSGSEANLTSNVFFELRRIIPEISKAKGNLFGLGDGLEVKSEDGSSGGRAIEFEKNSRSAANVFQNGKMGGI